MMNFKALLFHVLGKTHQNANRSAVSPPADPFLHWNIFTGKYIEQGRITRSWGAFFPDSTAAPWVVNAELIAPRCRGELWWAIDLALQL